MDVTSHKMGFGQVEVGPIFDLLGSTKAYILECGFCKDFLLWVTDKNSEAWHGSAI